MGLPLFKEKRFSPRSQLTGLLPGRLVNMFNQKDLNGKLVDVSSSGLGIILSEHLANDTEIKLITENYEIVLKVNWSSPDFGKRDLFRHGLTTVDPEVNLVRLFSEAGCLKQ